ncbi:MAG: HEAT repeat domain-containing protein [Rhodopirellula sp.]|nr:HEAT repeat domain-containing protein [Rhodopirellula sp.]
MNRLFHRYLFLRLAPICLLLLLAACSAGLVRAEEPLRTAASRRIDIHHIRLNIDLDLPKKHLAGRATIDFSPLPAFFEATRQPTIELDAHTLDVSAVRIAQLGAKASETDFELTDDQLLISTAEGMIKPGQKYSIEIDYSVTNPATGLHFFAPTEKAPDIPLMVWSQGEPQANHYWFPCLDNSNERQSTELIVNVPTGIDVLSNGTLLSRKNLAEGQTTFHWKQEKEHVAYLVTLVAGRFSVATEEWRGKPVTYYVPENHQSDIQRTFGRTKPMLEFFSERFGIEYPWDKYAQVVVEQFTFGGMENTSATTLYHRALHDERAIVDSTPDWLIAHELAHQWWGDLVTCKDWSHLWLNEGFATYSESLWAEHALGRDERDWHLLEDSLAGRSGLTQTRPIVDRHYPNPGSMFDNRVYPKGAWVLHMLRSRLGDEDFFRGLQRYGTVMAYQTAETSDLRKTFERLYGLSLERFFGDWTERPGNPNLLVETEWQPQSKRLKVHVKQTQKEDVFEIPVRIDVQLKGYETSQPAVNRLMNEREFTEYVALTGTPESIDVDPEFALLAKIEQKQSLTLWENQLQKQTVGTVPSRVRAVEHFATVRTDQSRQLLTNTLARDSFYGVREEAAKALGKVKGDAARDALLAGLTQENAKVRRACAAALEHFEGDSKVQDALRKKYSDGDISYFVESSVLSSLSKVLDKPPVELLIAALEKPSHRETIRLTALQQLAKSSDPKVQDVLLDWTQPGKPPLCRPEACQQLVEYANHNLLSKPATDRIAKHLLELLDTSGPRMRGSIASALGSLGNRASSAKTRLQELTKAEPNDWARSSIKIALERISAPASDTAALTKLQKELDEARNHSRSLEERLLRLEAE